jgi:hypothetical protein
VSNGGKNPSGKPVLFLINVPMVFLLVIDSSHLPVTSAKLLTIGKPDLIRCSFCLIASFFIFDSLRTIAGLLPLAICVLASSALRRAFSRLVFG